MPILDTAKNILKNIKSETTALNKTLRNRIDAAKVAENGILNYETKALEKTTVGEAAGAFKAITGEGPSVLGDAVKQAEFEKSLALDSSISKTLYDSTPLDLHVDSAVKEALAEPVSRPANVIGRQSGSRVPKNRVTRGKTGSYIKYEAPTPTVEASPTVETTSAVEDIAVQSPATAPHPEPTPVVNNAPAQATENVIPKNAQQEAVQNVEAAQASASPAQAAVEEAPWVAGSKAEKYQNFIEGLEKDAEFDAKYGAQLDSLRLQGSSFPAVTATGEQLGWVKPKQSEFTIQGSFGPTPPKPDFTIKSSENVLGSNAAAYDKPVTPILKSNGKVDYTKFKLTSPGPEEETAWSRGMKVALGTAVTGAALCAALSASRGQQNNAQLYGQQPIY